jgi:hypothetical protein
MNFENSCSRGDLPPLFGGVTKVIEMRATSVSASIRIPRAKRMALKPARNLCQRTADIAERGVDCLCDSVDS